jgi:2-oxoisovalerate dehydrogenase E1 component alpha subunit
MGEELLEISTPFLPVTLVQDLYARMLLTRLVDEASCQLYERGGRVFAGSCRGFEAAQVGSARCIEVGTDFTLPSERDLGVVLTIGMTPYEVFRTYLLDQEKQVEGGHWGYNKHNMVTGSASEATHILHAAGIAFAAKLRKAAVVTVAYCGDSATKEADLWEGIEFATLHQLPMICICEQSDLSSESSFQGRQFSPGLTCECLDGADVVLVYLVMQAAIRHAREGGGPVLLEMRVRGEEGEQEDEYDPLLRCRRYLKEQDAWDEEWATELGARLEGEVEQAMRDAVRDCGLNPDKLDSQII